MRSPAFWWRPRGALAGALTPAAALYGAIATRRLDRRGARATLPVICVGNVTVGGSGKTPAALALAALSMTMGLRPGFLTRGYGGALSGPITVDPGRQGASEVGDEALLLARSGPTVVSRDRPAGAAMLGAQEVDVIIMDDGLQNPSLAKDLSIAVFDGAVGVGNGLALPAGPLRAPMDAQWQLIDLVLVIGDGEAGEAIAAAATRLGRPVVRGRLRPDEETARRLVGARLLAFAGIGRPGKFFETLAACGADLVATLSFPDHYVFRVNELRQLSEEARRDGLRLVTTEKDAVRLGAAADEHGVETLPVELAFDDPQRMRDLISLLRPPG